MPPSFLPEARISRARCQQARGAQLSCRRAASSAPSCSAKWPAGVLNSRKLMPKRANQPQSHSQGKFPTGFPNSPGWPLCPDPGPSLFAPLQ